MKESGSNADFVLLHSYPTTMHAQMVVEALKQEGIPSLLHSNEMFGSGTGLGTLEPTRVDVHVPPEMLEAARDIADMTIDHL
ncbi:MAG TPA: DUF2007 domain-containing protein [candidate division Zixibacteria bacterium]|jgi:hypothetical protein